MGIPALVIVAIAAFVLAGCGGGAARSGATSTSAPAGAGTIAGAGTMGGSASAATTPAPVVTADSASVLTAGSASAPVPLWPFTSARAAQEWQASFRSDGRQPWHLDVEQTALTFTRSHLGYSEIDRVTSRSVHGTDARIGVGWSDPNERTATVAVLHLIRLGAGQDAPWVVVGTDDRTLALDHPRYGSAATSPLRVSGVITGVDESLHITVLSPASATPLGEIRGIPAGGQRAPWSAMVTFSAPAGTVLTVAVSTGGHLKNVEQFAVTAIRAA
jgi:hypothetical protein